MRMSPRVALAAGLCLAGSVGLVCQSFGRPPDSEVRRTNTSSPSVSRTTSPAVIGAIDVETVFKNYDKVKAISKRFEADVTAEKAKLAKLMADGEQALKTRAQFKPDSAEFKKLSDDIAEIEVKLESGRKKAQEEFARRDAETMAGLYKEIQAMTAAVAKKHGMTYIVKVSSEPVSGTDPNSVMAAMARTVVYSDPGAEITQEVITWLNYNYNKTGGGAASKATSAAPAATSPKGN